MRIPAVSEDFLSGEDYFYSVTPVITYKPSAITSLTLTFSKTTDGYGRRSLWYCLLTRGCGTTPQKNRLWFQTLPISQFLWETPATIFLQFGLPTQGSSTRKFSIRSSES